MSLLRASILPAGSEGSGLRGWAGPRSPRTQELNQPDLDLEDMSV